MPFFRRHIAAGSRTRYVTDVLCYHPRCTWAKYGVPVGEQYVLLADHLIADHMQVPPPTPPAPVNRYHRSLDSAQEQHLKPTSRTMAYAHIAAWNTAPLLVTHLQLGHGMAREEVESLDYDALLRLHGLDHLDQSVKPVESARLLVFGPCGWRDTTGQCVRYLGHDGEHQYEPASEPEPFDTPFERGEVSIGLENRDLRPDQEFHLQPFEFPSRYWHLDGWQSGPTLAMHLHEAHGMDKEPLDLLGLDVLRRMHSTDHSVTHRPLLSQRLDPEHMADIRSPLQPQHYMHALATEEGDEGHPKVYCGFDVASLPRDRYDGHVSNFVEVVTCQACRDVMEAEGNEPIVPAGSGWAPDFFAAVDEAQRSTIRRDARPSEGDASLLHQMLVGPSSDEPRVPVETLYDAEGNPVEVTVEVEPLAPQEHPIGAYFLQTPNERSLKLHVLFQAMIDGKDVTVPYGLDWKVRARITKIASSGTVSCRRLPGSDVLTYEPDVVEVIDE